MTYDTSKELAHHVLLVDLLGADAYPCHSWERGIKENTNGLIRQYFSKGNCFSKPTEEDVALVQDKLNSRPRKCIDYATPNDIFTAPASIALAA